jgi:phosphohistidine phosphatase
MGTLLLMRHAKSSWEHPGLTDFERPLKKRGRRAARRMAIKLREERLVPELILCSTAARARETLEGMVPVWNAAPQVILQDRLYHASSSELVDSVRELGETCSRVLVVGHNPGMEQLASEWSGRSVRFPTAAIAWFESDQASWNGLETGLSLSMMALWRPRDLPDPDTSDEWEVAP